MTRPIALLTITVVLVGGLAYLMDLRSRPVRLEGAPPRPQEEAPIFAVGRIEGATEPYELRPELVGRVAAVHVAPGQVVTQGATLLELDASELQARLQEAKAAADAAMARLAEIVNGPRPQELEAARQRWLAARARAQLHESRYRRLVALWERDAARREEVEDEQKRYLAAAAEQAAAAAELQLLQAGARTERRQAAEAELDAARSRVRQLEALLEKLTIRAPVNGIVVDVNCRVGEVIGPTTVEAAVVVVDDSRSRVRAFVEEYDVPRLRIGAPATVTVDGLPDRQFRGRVTSVSGIVRSKSLFSFEPGERYDTRVLEAWIDLDESVRLPVGLRVDVVIEASESSEVADARGP